ncbi:MAG TPA: trypsin-like peptidase domain-containing protein [Candidatus Eisenbacteria bacterium]|nr:trypsin-like peptidase domain-containing protein [Candidatus Eisenbacteria bacterium]
MRTMIIALFLAILACASPGVADARPTQPDAAMTEQVLSTVVRVDVGGYFRGSGVVVTPEGHIVVAIRTIHGYEYSAVTVGAPRYPARILAVDRRRGIAVLLAVRPADQAGPMPYARLDVPATVSRDDPARLAGYAETGSDPPMIARRTMPARVNDPHFRGEASGDDDVDDLLIARPADQPDRLRADGMPLFSSRSGRLLGVVIGRTGDGSNDLIAMPSSKIAATLTRLTIALPNGN